MERSRLFEFICIYFKGEINNRRVSQKTAMNVIHNLKTKLVNPTSNDVSIDDHNLQNIMNDINNAIDNYGNELHDISNVNLIDNLDLASTEVEDETKIEDTIDDTIPDDDNNSNNCNTYAIIDIIALGKEKMKSKGIQNLHLKRKQ